MKIKYQDAKSFFDSWGIAPQNNISPKIYNKMIKEASAIDKDFPKFISMISIASPGLSGMQFGHPSWEEIKSAWFKYKKTIKERRALDKTVKQYSSSKKTLMKYVKNPQWDFDR